MTMRPTHRVRHIAYRRTQQGVTLIIALIMMIAMTLAGLSMYRQVGTNVIVARNITFRQAATNAADRGVEDARTWVLAQAGGSLYNAIPTRGYYAAYCNTVVTVIDATRNIPDANLDGIADNCDSTPPPISPFDPLTYDWDGNNKSFTVTNDDGNGNRIRSVIHRLCSLPGDVSITDQYCTLALVSSTPENRGPGPIITGNVRANYRVTVRVDGPMNTVVYTQVVFH